jgi:aspartyl-tRNA synthetase
MPFIDVTDVLRQADFRIFQDTRESGARIRGIVVEGGAALSRRQLDELTPLAKAAGAPGAIWVRRTADGVAGQFAKALDEALTTRFLDATAMAEGDLFVAVVGHFRTAVPGSDDHTRALGGAEIALDTLRRHLADSRGLRRRPIMHGSGSRISRCSSGTTASTASSRRTIRSRRHTPPTRNT